MSCSDCRYFVQGGDVLVLEVDRHLDEPVLMFPLFFMSMAVMLMAAVFVVLMLLMSAHTASWLPFEPPPQPLLGKEGQ